MTRNLTLPAPFTPADYRARMKRVVGDAVEAGLDGMLVTPGPDLMWLTGYEPPAVTERLTALVLSPLLRPTLLVPALERPDAEEALLDTGIRVVDWADGADPYQVAHAFLPGGTFGVSDSAWSVHLLGLRAAMPSTRYHALSRACPCSAR